MMRTSLLFTLLVACGGLDEGPIEGPGIDPTDGIIEPQSSDYVIGITYLQVPNAPGPGKRFGDLANRIGNHLYDTEPEGWLGTAFRNDGRLHWWTISIFESEEAMANFVVSEPHLEAMAASSDVGKAGKTTHIVRGADDALLTWEEALIVLEGVEWDPRFED